ncbi:unnamed protein product [Mytilus edulis]|uniref:CCHC-type domain-containing protein n=1 Tax=Mytilus edulis TaxID=6550 RepID=A0A8S3T9C0_MYTED|nr:unnamed protein product [Mytilus edulis]
MVEDRLFRQPQQHSELPPRRETSFNDNMNYSFQPQWRQWNYFPCQLPTMPTCGRCGNKHLYKVCYSLTRSCYKCKKIGHYARMCKTSDVRKLELSALKCHQKSARQIQRDKKRMDTYIQNKKTCRELPFSNLKDTNFGKYLDVTCVIKTELKNVKQKFKDDQINQQNRVNELQSQLEKLVNEIIQARRIITTFIDQTSDLKQENEKLSITVDQYKESEAVRNQILEELTKRNSELLEELEEYKEIEEENIMFDSDGEETYFITNKDVDKILEKQRDTHLKLVSKLKDENRTLKSKMEHLTSVQCANSTIEKQETRLNTETRMSPMDIVDKLIQNQNSKHSTKSSSKNSKRKSRVSKNTF